MNKKMVEFKRVRKKPVEVEAFELTKEMLEQYQNGAYLLRIENRVIRCYKSKGGYFIIGTLEGEMIAKVGDFIIKGVEGEIYPCRRDIFFKTYDSYNTSKEEKNNGSGQ